MQNRKLILYKTFMILIIAVGGIYQNAKAEPIDFNWKVTGRATHKYYTGQDYTLSVSATAKWKFLDESSDSDSAETYIDHHQFTYRRADVGGNWSKLVSRITGTAIIYPRGYYYGVDYYDAERQPGSLKAYVYIKRKWYHLRSGWTSLRNDYAKTKTRTLNQTVTKNKTLYQGDYGVELPFEIDFSKHSSYVSSAHPNPIQNPVFISPAPNRYYTGSMDYDNSRDILTYDISSPLFVNKNTIEGTLLARELVPPVIGEVTTIPDPFSPNYDNIKDTTTITATLSETSDYEIHISDAEGQIVRKIEAHEKNSIDEEWDGKNDVGEIVDDGTYNITVFAADMARPDGPGYFMEGNRATIVPEDNFDVGLNPALWSSGIVGAGSASIGVSGGKLNLTARPSPGGSWMSSYLVSNQAVDYSDGLDIKAQMSIPTYAHGSSYKMHHEFYITPDFTTTDIPHDLNNWLRVAARVDGHIDTSGDVYERYGVHWMVQERVAGGGVNTLYTSYVDPVVPYYITDGTWTITLDEEYVNVKLDGYQIPFFPMKHNLPRDAVGHPEKVHFYTSFRNQVPKTYTSTFDFVNFPSVIPPGTTVTVNTRKPEQIILQPLAGAATGQVNLSWYAPYENFDETGGAVESYDLRYATVSFNAEDWDAGWLTAPGGEPDPPAEPGTRETMIITDLSPGITYYFAIKSQDAAGNISDMSDVVFSGAQQEQVVFINEIYTLGSTVAKDWVELYNKHSSPVSLAGWKLYYYTGAIGEGSEYLIWTGGVDDIIPSGGFFVLTPGQDLAARLSYHIKLLGPLGHQVDIVQWPVITLAQAELDSDVSIARIYDGGEFFEIDPTPTKGIANSVKDHPVKINEVFYSSPEREFVEFYNTSESAVYLENYSIRHRRGHFGHDNKNIDEERRVFSLRLNIYPKSFNSVNETSINRRWYKTDRSWNGSFVGGLTTTRDFLALENEKGQVVDRVFWGEGDTLTYLYNYRAEVVEYPSPAPGGVSDSSIGRQPDGYDTGVSSSSFIAFEAPNYPDFPTENVSNDTTTFSAALNTVHLPESYSAVSSSIAVKIKLGENSSAGNADTIMFIRTDGAVDYFSPLLFHLRDDLYFELESTVVQERYITAETTDISGNTLQPGSVYAAVLNTDKYFGYSAPSVTRTHIAYDAPTPEPITNLTAETGDTEGRVELSWTAPSDEEGTVVEYDIRYSTIGFIEDISMFFESSQPDNIPAPASPGQKQYFTVEDLTGGVTYYFRMRSKNDLGFWSDLSNSTHTWAQRDVTPPDAVDDLSAQSGPGNGEATLSWTATGDDGQEGDINDGWFEVRYSTDEAAGWNSQDYITVPTDMGQGSTHSYTVGGLYPDTTYYFWLKIADEVPNWSLISNTATAVAANLPPVAPVGLTVIALYEHEYRLDLAWTPGPEPDLDYYKIYRSTVSGTVGTKIFISSPAAAEYIDLDLENYVTYYYQVTVVDFTQQEGNPSEEVSAYPRDDIPPASIKLKAVTGLQPGEIDLSWTASGDNGTIGYIDGGEYWLKYDYEEMTAPFDEWWEEEAPYEIRWPTNTEPGQQEQITVTGLKSDTTYHFAIRLSDEAGNWSAIYYSPGEQYAVTLDTIPPSAVTNLTAATGETEGKIDLSWTSPGDNWMEKTLRGGFAIQYSTFAAEWSTASAQVKFSTTTEPGTTVHYTLTGLEGGSTYYMKVWAYDKAGNWSQPSVAVSTMAQVDVTPPAAIEDLYAFPGELPGSITITWTAPGDDGTEGTATEYRVRYSTNEITEEAWDTATEVIDGIPVPEEAGTTQEMTVEGLEEGTTYYFAIKTLDEVPNISDISNSPFARATDVVQRVLISKLSRGTTDHQYNLIELYNPTDRDIKVDNRLDLYIYQPGWTIAKATIAWPAGDFKINRESHIILATTDTVTIHGEDVEADLVFETSAEFGSSAGVEIVHTQEGTSDAVGWGWSDEIPYEDGKFPQDLPRGGMLERKAYHDSTAEDMEPDGAHYGEGNGYDSDRNWFDFVLHLPYEGYMPPAKITDLAPVSIETTSESVMLSWTAPGADGMEGDIEDGSYHLRYSTYLINSQVPSSDTDIIWSTSTSPNHEERKTVTELLSETTYYLQIRTEDDLGSWSEWSNVAAEQTIKTNFLLNPYFEDWSIANGDEIPDYWDATIGNYDRLSKSTDAYIGNYSARIVPIGSNENLNSFKDTFFEADGTYVAEVWVKGASSVTVRVGIAWASHNAYGSWVELTDNEWTKISYTRTRDVDGTNDGLLIQFKRGDSPTGTPLYIGAARLSPYDTGGGMNAASLPMGGPDATFKLGEVYSFPNPARRRDPTIHVEVGVADEVEIRIYNVAAEIVKSVKLTGIPQIINGKYAYEYLWDVSNVASGVYIYHIRATKDGRELTKLKKLAVIK